MKEKIKNFIKENWFKILLILIIGLPFYWYEWRPTQAKKECSSKASDLSKKTTIDDFNKTYDLFYKICLRNKGL